MIITSEKIYICARKIMKPNLFVEKTQSSQPAPVETLPVKKTDSYSRFFYSRFFSIRALYSYFTMFSEKSEHNCRTSYWYTAAILARFFFIRVFKEVLYSEFVE